MLTGGFRYETACLQGLVACFDSLKYLIHYFDPVIKPLLTLHYCTPLSDSFQFLSHITPMPNPSLTLQIHTHRAVPPICLYEVRSTFVSGKKSSYVHALSRCSDGVFPRAALPLGQHAAHI
jgi:hypothetical protein